MDNKCSICHGNGKIGNRVTGFKTCPACSLLNTNNSNFTNNYKPCIDCGGTGKIGDYLTGFLPCPGCMGIGAVKISI